MEFIKRKLKFEMVNVFLNFILIHKSHNQMYLHFDKKKKKKRKQPISCKVRLLDPGWLVGWLVCWFGWLVGWVGLV